MKEQAFNLLVCSIRQAGAIRRGEGEPGRVTRFASSHVFVFPAGAMFVKFNELVRLLKDNDFVLIKEKGSIRYYGKPGWKQLVRVDYHGAKEIPTGTCQAILKAAGIKKGNS